MSAVTGEACHVQCDADCELEGNGEEAVHGFWDWRYPDDA